MPQFTRSVAVVALLALTLAIAASPVTAATPVVPSASQSADVQPTAAQPAAVQPADSQDGSAGSALVDSCAVAPPDDRADPEGGTAGTVGWVDGYWYDEPIEVDAGDGLDAGERERLTARTAARVEALRCLSFEERPPVEVLTREEYAREIETDVGDRAERIGDLKDAQYQAMLLLGPEQDWGDVRATILSKGVGAYYDPDAEQISMIVESADQAPVEHVLAHELVHALQDQQFDLHRFDASQQSRRDAELGVIEGDARLIQQQYQRRCDAGRWSSPCVEPRDRSVPQIDDNAGTAVLFEQPYLYGPAFVERVYQEGGWDAVDRLYDELPAHSSAVVASESEAAANASLPSMEDRSSDEWERVTASGRPDAVVVGQAALTSMFVAPAVESGTSGSVISLTSLVDPQRRTPSNFDQPETSGWRGDRMYAYTDGDRLATVWALAWVDATEAERFASAYESLLEVRGAEAVDDRAGVYVLNESTGFDAAVRVTVDGERVEVVTAPTVAALSAVGGSGPETGGSNEVPGFGIAAAVLAVFGTILAMRSRR